MKPIIRTLQRTLACAAVLACSIAAHAAGSVEYEVRADKEVGRMSVEWLDSQRIRMDAAMPGMPAGMQAWQVLRDGRVYSVQVNEGKPMVFELGGMMKMLGGMLPKGAAANAASTAVEDFHSLKATGRRETVAGISGEVFVLDYRPEGGQRQQVEVVLSDHRTVREMTQAMNSYAQAMLRAMGTEIKPGSDRLEAELGQRQMGMLRFGDQMRAVRVSSQAPDPRRLDLPAEPMSMPQLPGLAGMMGGQPAGGAVQRQVERQQDRQQERVSERAQAEADAAADRTVDKAIGKALGRIFGR